MRGRARDLEDIELTMQFDPLTLCWQPVEEEEEEDERREEETEAEKAILKALKGLAKVKASTVANMVGAHRGNTSTRLQKLWKEGKVRMELIDNISYYFLEEPKGEMEGHSV